MYPHQERTRVRDVSEVRHFVTPSRQLRLRKKEKKQRAKRMATGGPSDAAGLKCSVQSFLNFVLDPDFVSYPCTLPEPLTSNP